MIKTATSQSRQMTTSDNVQSNQDFYHEMIDQYYRHKPAYGLYDKVIDIEKWFHAERPTISALLNYNTPLVIVGPEGSGRTSLIYQWIQFHEAKSEFFVNIFDKNTYLLHFVCSSNIKNNHYQMISRLINKMRTLFDLNQRIEMQNDKLRTFFFRWLELADKKKKLMSTEKCKIILVIDGIDRFEIDENTNNSKNAQFQQQLSKQDVSINKVSYTTEEEPPDWFPQCFPQTFRVIVTCKKNSKAYQHFKNMKLPFQFLNVPDITEDTLREIVEAHFEMSSSIEGIDQIPILKDGVMSFILKNVSLFNNQLYLHTFLHVIHPLNVDLKTFKLTAPTLNEVQEYKTIEDLFKFALKHYETNKILPRSKFRRISCIMAVSKTGLRKEELKDCLEVKVETVELFLKVFNFALLEHRQQYRVNNEVYKKTIEKFYLQEELFKNEIHSSIVTILSKVKHFNSNPRLIDEVTYNIYKQGNQWLRLKDLLSNLEIFCQLYKPQDKYFLSQFWQKLEQHGFDPVYEYNKTVEAFVLNYFPTPSELFVVLTQLGRFFKELGDLETKCTPEFKHPPLIVSPELDQIKLQKELENIGGMLTENKQNATPTAEEERYNVENPLFMQVYREKQVIQLRKENPLFPSLQLYYYKRWIWLQFPWFCMDINSSFSTYMNKAMGKSIHLHMSFQLEMDLVVGSLKIIKEAKSRKQLSGKNQIYAVPIEFTLEEEELQREREETRYSSSDDSMTSKITNIIKSPKQKTQKSIHSPYNNASNAMTPRVQLTQNHHDFQSHQISQFPDNRQSLVMTARNARTSTGSRFMIKAQSQSRLSDTAQTQRNSMMFERSQHMEGLFKQSQYSISKAKWINQDFELASLKKRIKPENAVRVVSKQVNNYERKELETAVLSNREMINELNKVAFEIQQKERIFQSLQNCILQLNSNNKESQAFEKKLSNITDKLDSTKTQYRIARKEQNRLRHIVNFCFKNKADNHEWIQGLELAVQNMIILIKHEKESIIESKNLVIEIKKESKELLKLKEERKMLQTKTTQTMYGMINEKQCIKTLREEFNKRKEQIMLGMILPTESDISTFQKSEFEEIKRSRDKSYSPQKSIFGGDRQGNYLRSKNRNSNDPYQSNQSDQSQNPISENQKKFISKIDKIRHAAGVKSIENYQQIIDFWNSYHRLMKERDSREQAIQKLKAEKQKMLSQLEIFHQQDIDKSNLKYQPHSLVNNISERISDASIVKNQQYAVLQKSYDQIINVRTLIEEIRKKLKQDNSIFLKNLNEINGEDLVGCLLELQNYVETRQNFVKKIFGDLPFHETMILISQANPRELRAKIQQQMNTKSRQSILQNQKNHTQEHNQDFQMSLQSNKDFVPKIVLNVYSDHTSEQQELISNYDHNYEGIFVEDMDFNLQPLESPGFLDVNFKYDSKSQISLNAAQQKKMVKRGSKFLGQDLQITKNMSVPKNNQLANRIKKDILEPQLINIYQIPRPIFLDESSYTQSILNMSRSLKEKETLFYKRVDEQEKNQDIIAQTLNAIHEFKKKAEPLQSSIDDSFKYLEEERKNIKSREKQQNYNNSRQNSAIRKKANGRKNSQEYNINMKNEKFSINQNQHQGFATQRDHQKDQDDEPPMSNMHIKDENEQNHKSVLAVSHGHLTQRIDQKPHLKTLKFETKYALDSYLNGEANKLPTYAKSILTSNHKDIVQQIRNLNSSVKKMDKDDLFKKLMAQTEKHKKLKSSERFAHQNL